MNNETMNNETMNNETMNNGGVEQEKVVNDGVRQEALDYLVQHQVVTLATVGAKGVWAAAVFYASAGFQLTFLSAAHTRHAQNIHANPRVAATIQEDYGDWPSIKGIQLEGVVSLLEGDARAAAIIHYQTKYPFLAHAEPAIQKALTRVNWYRLSPERLYYIDNSKGFGQRDEVKIVGSGEWGVKSGEYDR